MKSNNKDRIEDYDIVRVNEPPITGVWIFLTTGHCLFHYKAPNMTKDIDEHIIAGFLSSINALFEETQDDKCNVIFGFKQAYYYNYLKIHTKRPIALISVISTRLIDGFSPSDILSCDLLTLKGARILIQFFNDYMNDIIDFNGRVDDFNSFSVECGKIIRS